MEIFEKPMKLAEDSKLRQLLLKRVEAGKHMNEKREAFAKVLNENYGFDNIGMNDYDFRDETGMIFLVTSIDKFPETMQPEISKSFARGLAHFKKRSTSNRDLVEKANETGTRQAIDAYRDVDSNIKFMLADFQFAVGHSPAVQRFGDQFYADVAGYSEEDLENEVFNDFEPADIEAYQELAFKKLAESRA